MFFSSRFHPRRPAAVFFGTSLEMNEKHYGDARVDAEQLDEMIGELEPPTRNLPEPFRVRAMTRCRRR